MIVLYLVLLTLTGKTKKNMTKTFFAPQLYLPSGVRDISFYTTGLSAVELRRWTNEDGSLHVAELSIHGAIFQIHEEKPARGQFEPIKNKGVTTLIGLFVEDVDAVMASALNAGATLLNPAQNYDYGYRQGEFKDPFGHHWMIETRI
jgi:PhnB protein